MPPEASQRLGIRLFLPSRDAWNGFPLRRITINRHRRRGLDEQSALPWILIPSGIQDGPGFVHQFFQRLKLAIHACESDIGNLIEPTQAIRDQLPNRVAEDFTIVGREYFLLDFIRDPRQLALRHRPLEASPLQPAKDARAVPGNPAPILLHNGQPGVLFDPLVSGETLRALLALAAPPD